MTVGVDVYTTVPHADDASTSFRRTIADTIRWSEAAGAVGLSLPGGHDRPDPWVGAQYVLERSETLVPLIATDAADLHPLATARKIAALAAVYGRRVDLDLVATEHPGELRALGIFLDHHQRHDRLAEYGQVIAALLSPGGVHTYRGHYYEISSARVHPALPAGCTPRLFVTGSSPAATAAGRVLGAIRISDAPALDGAAPDAQRPHGGGLRLGLIARETAAQAWQEAHRRHPEAGADEPDSVFWAHPQQAAAARCPYLVGSAADVAQALARYVDLGLEVLVLGPVHDEDDLQAAIGALRLAERLAAGRSASPMRGWSVDPMPGHHATGPLRAATVDK
ncbi:LLM class flavin-dependent oxidoreductase [Dactylosporangium matsuzakiense]|uniref:Oxidoreductase n=1 Tax=Dactylosporangium matsuzakiense TaxID=53360 RepID=A0A9W6KXZ2_9ACTN|nr:LLM class flavin-dependent oxidoreductase [Dactylosporangium matsuzakiense]GLL08480.1 oxidoreductase [Dactylosporangium matsuzakiense]